MCVCVCACVRACVHACGAVRCDALTEHNINGYGWRWKETGMGMGGHESQIDPEANATGRNSVMAHVVRILPFMGNSIHRLS